MTFTYPCYGVKTINYHFILRKVTSVNGRLLRSCSSTSSTAHSGRKTRDKVRDVKREEMLDRIIRVDHAGELGADRIYAGQMFVLGNSKVGPTIKTMWEQEKHHLATFEKLIPKYRVRPSLLTPFWNVAGFGLGAGSALLGSEAAMACTVAVEEVIGNHYNDQLRELMEDDAESHKELLDIIKQFRDDELHHLQTGMDNDAEKAPAYKLLTDVIKVGCRGAIWLAERV